MGKLSLTKLACIVFAFCVATAIASPAQNLTALYSFPIGLSNPAAGLVQASDGNLYGTTLASTGSVFQITTGGTLTYLYTFSGPDGLYPYDALIQGSDGNLYGTTSLGGANQEIIAGVDGGGTIFRITTGGALTTLYNFCSQPYCTDGSFPTAGLIQASDGNFYGTTEEGGLTEQGNSLGAGTVFQITPGGALTTLYGFSPYQYDGAYPYAGLIQASDGNLYGTTSAGGTNSQAGTFLFGGTVFKIPIGGTIATTLYNFCSQVNGQGICTDGTEVFAALTQATDGNFYGTTYSGGSGPYGACNDAGCGTVFKITPGGTLTTLYSFCSQPNCTDGVDPVSGLIQAADGNLYGTTLFGGNQGCSGPWANPGCGTIFRITLGGALTTLYRFCSQPDCADGSAPYGGVIQASDGNFYGTTYTGGAAGAQGTVFRLTLTTTTDTLSPASLSFGSEAVNNASAAKTVTLKNTGSATLVSNITITPGTAFAISSNTCGSTLAVKKSCKVSVTFTPTTLGLQTGTLMFADNTANSPQTVALSGTGVADATLTPASLTFSKTKVGETSAAKKVTLKNDQPTTLSSISYSATPPFAVSASTCTTTLNSKESCTISVTFSPTATGAATGTLTVSDSASNSPQTSSLAGTGD